MNNARILVIEDDVDINEVVCAQLSKDGCVCTAAYSGSEACLQLERDDFDCIVTDLMLPGASGGQVIKRLRDSGGKAPIIVISARDTVSERVAMLRLGADDYLVKPFDLNELTARVRAQLRGRSYAFADEETNPRLTSAMREDERSDADRGREHMPSAQASLAGQGRCLPEDGTTAWSDGTQIPVIRAARWELSPSARTFSIDGERIVLTNLEFGIIELLMTHPGIVFTKQQIYELCWHEPYVVDDNTVTAHMSKIRAKLKPSGTEGYITTVWGLGFKLDA